jgi:putative flippase GtrA
MQVANKQTIRALSALHGQRLFAQSFKFAIVGVTSTSIHSACYLLALRSFPPQLANVLGFLCAVSVTYCGNRFWTFRGGRTGRASIWRFAVTSLIGFACNATIVSVVSNRRDWGPDWAVAGIAFVTPMVTFILLRLWVFRMTPPRRPSIASE